MKNFKKLVLALLIASPFMLLAAGDEMRPALSECGVKCWFAPDTDAGDENGIRVNYILDSEGKPSIVSVFSNDQASTDLIRIMMKDLGMYPLTRQEPDLNFSFYYDHIR